MVCQAVLAFALVLLGGQFRRSQIKTLAACVMGLLESHEPAGMGPIGRHLPASAGKHGVKRVYRFAHNPRITLKPYCEAVIAFLTRHTSEVIVAMDWTDIGPWKVLTSAIVTRHRAIPVFWSVICNEKTRMPPTEQAHVEALLSYIPAGKALVLSADAGFDSIETLSHLLKLGVFFIVRFGTTVGVRLANQSRARTLRQQRLSRDLVDYGVVGYHSTALLQLRFVRIHAEGQKDAWNLITNLPAPSADHPGRISATAVCIVALYGRRFTIEELFRDFKGGNWQLQKTTIQSPEVLARFLLIPALTHLVLSLAGAYAERQELHRKFQTNTATRRVLALWRVGRLVLKNNVVAVPFETLGDSLALGLCDLRSWAWPERPQTYGTRRAKPKARPEHLPAAALRTFMTRFQLTAQTLAAYIKVLPGTISEVRRGKRQVPHAWVPLLCTLADISREALFALSSTDATPTERRATKKATPRSSGSSTDVPRTKLPAPSRLWLQSYIERFSLTHQQLADDLGVDRSLIGKVISGRRNLPERWLARLFRPERCAQNEFRDSLNPALRLAFPETG